MFRNRKHASACSQGPHSGEASFEKLHPDASPLVEAPLQL